MNPLYILVGLLAIAYLPTFLGAAKLDVKFANLTPLNIGTDKISMNAGLQFTNKSSTRLVINKIYADVLFNGVQIGTVQQNLSVAILPGRSQIIGNYIEVSVQTLGTQLWQSVINKNLQNTVVEFYGYVTVNNSRFQFRTNYTIQDFISGIGIGSVNSSNDYLADLINRFSSALKKYCAGDAIQYRLCDDLFHKMILKAGTDDDYRDMLAKWLGKSPGYSTIVLRDLAAEVGYDYWKNLQHSNIIDTLDTVNTQKY